MAKMSSDAAAYWVGDSDERYRLLVESVRHYGMFIIDMEGRIDTWNKGAERIYGYTAEEIVGQHWSTLSSPEDHDKAQAELRAASIDGTFEDDGFRVRKDGSRFWGNVVVGAIRDHSGRLLGYAHITRDFTQRRLVEEEIRSNRERLRLLVENIHDYAIFGLDLEGRMESWNPGAELIKGYKAAEVIGAHIGIFYSVEDRTAGRPQRLLAQALAEGRAEDEGWRVRKDGSRFWANVVITALRDQSGTPIGFVNVTRDLTERRKAEECLRQSEERFRLIVDSVKDYAIFMLDPEGRVTTWNRGAERIKGYAASEVIGRHFSMFYLQEDVRAGECRKELDAAASVGRFEDEGWRVRRDGSKFCANIVITALRDARGNLMGFVKVARDLTDSRRREQERVALAHAQEAIRLRDEFLSIASHELKTPLTALQLQLHALQNKLQGDPELTRRVAKAVRSGERLAEFIEALLDVARISSGRVAFVGKRFDLVHTASDVIENLQDAATQAGCELRLHAEGPLFGVWDPLRIQQVFLNLLSNAIKYGRGGPIDVAIHRDADGVVIEVTDSGSGIAEEDLARIFERFERAVPMRHYGGLGLGLYVTREIACGHGGSISAANVPGRGACFTVRLPIEARFCAMPSGATSH